MDNVTHPDPEQVRIYMQSRLNSQTAPLSPDEIRRQLGWHLIQAEREAELPRPR